MFRYALCRSPSFDVHFSMGLARGQPSRSHPHPQRVPKHWPSMLVTKYPPAHSTEHKCYRRPHHPYNAYQVYTHLISPVFIALAFKFDYDERISALPAVVWPALIGAMLLSLVGYGGFICFCSTHMADGKTPTIDTFLRHKTSRSGGIRR
jgi:hypothetical protein